MVSARTAMTITLFALAGCYGGAGGDVETKEMSARAEETGPRMRPGENCLRCHSENAGKGAPPWSAGGTIFPRLDAPVTEGVSGVKVFVKDAEGKEIVLTTNEVGNFYTAEPLTKPYRVAIEYGGRRREMPVEAPAGSCNACHSHPDAVGGAKGRIFVP